MNKSMLTNAIALILLVIGYQFEHRVILYAGVFAFSGAVTNWLAIHMLFEKVPGLYGSGVIPARFEDFKAAIKQLMMEQFFTQANIERFLNQEESTESSLDLEPIIASIDFNPTFDSLVEVIAQSSFGGMLAMFGGTEALLPLKQPFVEKIQQSVIEISQGNELKRIMNTQLKNTHIFDDVTVKIENIIDQRLNELTPQLVKEIIQKMIKQHLGWLVVWGGVFGGLIGVASSFWV